jgi:hypothetical protein
MRIRKIRPTTVTTRPISRWEALAQANDYSLSLYARTQLPS